MKFNKINIPEKLSLLWIFVTVNYIFCDVFTLMYHKDLQEILTGRVGDMEITQEFLLAFAFVLEIPMIMILLSRFLSFRLNRILNILAGVIMTVVQAGSLTAGGNTLHYIFFSIVEIATTVAIIYTAYKWQNGE